MSSVTARIKEIKQPRNGYLKISEFNVKTLKDNRILNENENIHASVIGMTVDYMTRFIMGVGLLDAFKISIIGASFAEKIGLKNTIKEINEYLKGIKGLDDASIINACKMVTFDVWYRNPFAAMKAKTAQNTNPNAETIENIKILIERSLEFWKKYGPIKVDGFTFENGGYTDKVNSGDGDFLTEDTLWDFKVSKAKPKKDHTLQLLMYYIMGIHSGKEEFKNIKKLGIYNPRLNKVYQFEVKNISDDIIKEIEKNVICYK